MRKFFVEHNEASGETTVGLGEDRLVFTPEEWRVCRMHFGTTVAIEEKHPVLALFGTRTDVRWFYGGSHTSKSHGPREPKSEAK